MQQLEIKNKIFGKGLPKVCIPLVAKDENQLENQIERIISYRKENPDSSIDVVEFRGDYFDGLMDMERLTRALNMIQESLCDIIILFTIRSEQEGGCHLNGGTQKINDINRYVIDNGLADMVDVELFSGEECASLCELAKEKGIRIIMSNHDFGKTPAKEEIIKRLTKMKTLGADIAKIAVMPQRRSDVITLLSATLELEEGNFEIPVVTMSMGKMGAISRISGEVFGSSMTFASLEHASAPGQIPLDIMDKALQAINRYCV